MKVIAVTSTPSEVAATRGFAWLSIVMAILVSLGTRSWLPVGVISFFVCASWLLTDRLGLIRLSRLAGYICMLLGAFLALAGYWIDTNNIFNLRFDSLMKPNAVRLNAISNLDAVSRMLIYIQVPLMFQRKDKRLFEHWGVFLILELVVAALLSDNAAFGMLLFPTLILSCLAMVYLASYVGECELRVEPSATFLPSFLSKLLPARLIDNPNISSIQYRPILSLSDSKKPVRRAGWLVLVVGASVSLFALIYFFGLPRLHSGAFEGLGRQKPMVGFSGTIKLNAVGSLMMNNDLALRLFMTDPITKLPYQPAEPPYLRGVVADVYGGNDSEESNDRAEERGAWHLKDADGYLPQPFTAKSLRNELIESTPPIVVNIQATASLQETPFSLPPFFVPRAEESYPFDRSTWCLSKPSPFEERKIRRDRYEFESLAFNDTGQTPLLFDVAECLRKRSELIPVIDENGKVLNARERLIAEKPHLVAFDRSKFNRLIGFRDSVLASFSKAKNVEKVLVLEEYLASGRSNQYSLTPTVDFSDKDIDPIEDFIANRREGHCQYFASALAILARTMNLPSRIVLGFHPAEYNEIGNFLAVRQRHAHAWVEVYFDRTEFEGSGLELPEWIEGGAWVRFDPTPSGDGSNAGGTFREGSDAGKAYESLEQLWQESFMSYDSTRQPAAFNKLSSWTGGPVASMLISIEKFYLRLQTRSLTSFSFNAIDWISWQLGLAVVSLTGFVLLIVRYRSLYVKLLGLASIDLFSRKQSTKVRLIPFFQRTVRALKRLGWERQPFQTPQEFSTVVQPFLDQIAYSQATQPPQLRPLIEVYYNVRFGEYEIPSEKFTEVEAIVEKLEALAQRQRKWFN
jgi:protein-glutamine gamma-glutamyltransferase